MGVMARRLGGDFLLLGPAGKNTRGVWLRFHWSAINGEFDSMHIRNLEKKDFFLFNQMDWSPLPKERDSIYIILAIDQADCSFVAEEDGEFLGVVLCTRSASGQSIYVNHIWVKEKARGKEVGRKLMASLEQYAARQGVRRIWLFCWDELMDWYKSQGYREDYNFLSPELKDYVRKVKEVRALMKNL